MFAIQCVFKIFLMLLLITMAVLILFGVIGVHLFLSIIVLASTYKYNRAKALDKRYGLAIDTLPYYNAVYPKLYYDSSD